MNRVIQAAFGQLEIGCEFTVPRVGRFRKVEPVQDGDTVRAALHLKTGGLWAIDGTIPVNVKTKDAHKVRDLAVTLTFDVSTATAQARGAPRRLN